MKKHWLVIYGSGRTTFVTRADAQAAAEKVAAANPGEEIGVYEFVGSMSLPKVPAWKSCIEPGQIARITG